MDPASLTGLRGLIGNARFATYLSAYQGREDLALRLYSWNAALSSALWGPLGVVEVGVRNAIHAKLVDRASRSDWWHDQRLWDQLLDRQRDEVTGAINTITRRVAEPTADDVVAASNFGLWVGLLSAGIPRDPIHSYEIVLWQPRLRLAFPHYAGGRKQLHGELDAVRKLRNRVAHHEPIFRSNLAFAIDSIAKVAGYISPDAETYIRASERVTGIIAAKRDYIADGDTRF
jgi:hypothetical protein